jgi:hypothetical protein
MSVIFPLLLVVIILACAASLYNEGMWGNAINLVNVIMAGLLAFNFFEPLAKWIESWGDFFAKNTFYLDFLSLWFVFAVSLIVLRTASNLISRVKVRFVMLYNRIGSGVLAVLVGWFMASFTAATLHTAPLAEKFMKGGFDARKRMMFGLAPDRQWLGFVNMASKGGFSRGEEHEFDPDGQFIVKYEDFRAAVEKQAESGSITGKDSPIPSRSE